MKAFLRWTTVLALLAAPALVAAQQQGAEPPVQEERERERPMKLSKNDLQVVAHYQMIRQHEIELGKMGQRRSDSREVRQYAEMIVQDHERANEQLTAMVKQTGQRVPKVKPANDAEKKQMNEQRAAMKRLGKLEGAAFDREFLKVALEGHEQKLARIDAKIGDVEQPELAEHLRELKPVLQRHADRARELQKADAQARK
jgi:putative membrane protein